MKTFDFTYQPNTHHTHHRYYQYTVPSEPSFEEEEGGDIADHIGSLVGKHVTPRKQISGWQNIKSYAGISEDTDFAKN